MSAAAANRETPKTVVKSSPGVDELGAPDGSERPHWSFITLPMRHGPAVDAKNRQRLHRPGQALPLLFLCVRHARRQARDTGAILLRGHMGLRSRFHRKTLSGLYPRISKQPRKASAAAACERERCEKTASKIRLQACRSRSQHAEETSPLRVICRLPRIRPEFLSSQRPPGRPWAPLRRPWPWRKSRPWPCRPTGDPAG